MAVPPAQPRRRIPLPPGEVWLAFAVSRAVVLAALVFVTAGVNGDFGVGQLQGWDGAWYVGISRDGYAYTERIDEWAVAEDPVKTAYPYFPGLPALLWAGAQVGLPRGLTGVVGGNLALLLALWGVRVLAARHYSARVGRLAVWALALFPGIVPLGMVYPEAYLLAAGAWAFVALEDGRDGRAAALAAVSALLRPNGIVVAIALAVAMVIRHDFRRGLKRAAVVAVPAFAVLAAWIAVLWVRTGDPLVFYHAKEQWREVTLYAALLDAFFDIKSYPQWHDIAMAAVGAVFVALQARRMPAAWTVLWALWVLPSLVLGTVGLGRYTATCFVVPVAAGATLARFPPWVRVGLLVGSACGLAFAAAQMFEGHWVP